MSAPASELPAPYPLRRYPDLLSASLGHAELAGTDSLLVPVLGGLEVTPDEARLLRQRGGDLRAALQRPVDELPDLTDAPSELVVLVALAVAAQAAHTLVYWNPVLDLGRRGQFNLHLADLRACQARIDAVLLALARKPGGSGDAPQGRLHRLHAEVSSSLPDPSLRATGIVAAKATRPRAKKEEGAPPAAPVPPARGNALRRRRLDGEDRSRGFFWLSVTAGVFLLVAALALTVDPRAQPRDALYYRRYAPVTDVTRAPLLVHFELDADFDNFDRNEQKRRMRTLVEVVQDERVTVSVIEFSVRGRMRARWDGGVLVMVD